MNIGVVIVTWNSAETIEACLASCGSLPVVVVDNASCDDTADRVRRFSNVYLIANSVNTGFAAAANQGIAASATDYILLLNPDVELRSTVDPLLAECRHSDVAIVTSRLITATGAVQTGFNVRRFPTPAALALEALGLNRLFPSNPVNRRYRCADFDFDAAADVEQPAGAFLFFRRSVWEQLGGFDEEFHPVWFEDVDFCRRAVELRGEAGRMRIRYVPDVTARHLGGRSIARLDWESREFFWYGSLLRYASKHFSLRGFRGVCSAVVLASAARCFPSVVQRRSVKPITVYAGIFRLAVQCLFTGGVRPPEREQFRHQGSRVRTITSSTK